MYKLKASIPYDAITDLSSIILEHPESCEVQLSAGSIINKILNNESSIFLIKQGCVSLYRKHDDKLIFDIVTPFIFGIVQSLSKSDNYYLYCNSRVSLVYLNDDRFNENLNTVEILKHVLEIVCYLIDAFEESQKTKNNSTNNYDVIKGCLYQIAALSEQERQTESIFKFIMSRHNISRSSIAKIIKTLSDGGYINVKRGVLLSMNKLPKGF